MPAKVSIVSCSDYEQGKVWAAVQRCLDLIGGIKAIVSPGQRVVLKPNLLCAASPEEAITTHPAVVEAVVRLVQEAGAYPIIADSPGSSAPYNERGLRRVYETCGLAEVARRTGAKLNWDTTVLNVSHPEGLILKRLDIIKPILDADVVINLPKLKTHVYTTFSGAVKNLFGVIPGYKKPGYHAKLDDLTRFSEMLLDVFAFVKPQLSLMDGILALEGDGPGRHGKPKQVGVLLASRDSLALDIVACRLVGFAPERVPALAAAQRCGWWDDIEIIGESLGKISIADFLKPSVCSDPAGYVSHRWMRTFIHPLLVSIFTPHPIPRREDCTGCGTCVRSCPQKAITLVEKLAVVDNDRCIRCYCCHELCPEAAIDLKLSWLGQLLQKSGVMGKMASS